MTNQQNATGATAENINHIPFETDAGVAHRAAIGLIVNLECEKDVGLKSIKSGQGEQALICP